MWKLVLAAEQSHSRPSEMLPWVRELDALNPFVRYEFDACVATFAVIIKNALQETVEQTIGGVTRHVPRYRLAELLQDDFRFPPQLSEPVPVGDGGSYDEVS